MDKLWQNKRQHPLPSGKNTYISQNVSYYKQLHAEGYNCPNPEFQSILLCMNRNRKKRHRSDPGTPEQAMQASSIVPFPMLITCSVGIQHPSKTGFSPSVLDSWLVGTHTHILVGDHAGTWASSSESLIVDSQLCGRPTPHTTFLVLFIQEASSFSFGKLVGENQKNIFIWQRKRKSCVCVTFEPEKG